MTVMFLDILEVVNHVRWMVSDLSPEIDCTCTDYLEHVEWTDKGEIVRCRNCGSRYYNLHDDLVWIDEGEM